MSTEIAYLPKRLFSVISNEISNQPGYDATIRHLAINKNTKVICQGFTGKQVWLVLPNILEFNVIGNFSFRPSDRIWD